MLAVAGARRAVTPSQQPIRSAKPGSSGMNRVQSAIFSRREVTPVLNRGALEGGTAHTIALVEGYSKPCLVAY